jgi:hypothetical protein
MSARKERWRGWGCDRIPGEPLLSPPNIFKIKKALSATYKYIKYKSTHNDKTNKHRVGENI